MDELYTVLKYILYILLGGTCLLCSIMIFFNIVLGSKKPSGSSADHHPEPNSSRNTLDQPLSNTGTELMGGDKPKPKTKEEAEEEMERKFFGTTFKDQYKIND